MMTLVARHTIFKTHMCLKHSFDTQKHRYPWCCHSCLVLKTNTCIQMCWYTNVGGTWVYKNLTWWCSLDCSTINSDDLHDMHTSRSLLVHSTGGVDCMQHLLAMFIAGWKLSCQTLPCQYDTHWHIYCIKPTPCALSWFTSAMCCCPSTCLATALAVLTVTPAVSKHASEIRQTCKVARRAQIRLAFDLTSNISMISAGWTCELHSRIFAAPDLLLHWQRGDLVSSIILAYGASYGISVSERAQIRHSRARREIRSGACISLSRLRHATGVTDRAKPRQISRTTGKKPFLSI